MTQIKHTKVTWTTVVYHKMLNEHSGREVESTGFTGGQRINVLVIISPERLCKEVKLGLVGLN